MHFLQKVEDAIGNPISEDLSDIPDEGETLEDIDRADRSNSRRPANDSLIRVFNSSHDYIYGNEGRKKDAFWQLLNLIFCKLYDEKRRFICAKMATATAVSLGLVLRSKMRRSSNEGQLKKRVVG